MEGGGSLEQFIAAVHAAVRDEADANADNRWWVMAPTLVAQHRDGSLDFVPIDRSLAERPVGRALMASDPRALLDALGARRCAIVLHVDIARDDELFAAIAVAALSAMTASVQFAPVERTETGTPRLGAWEVGGMTEGDVFDAVRRAVAREP